MDADISLRGVWKRLQFRFSLWLSARLLPLRLRGRDFSRILALAPASSAPRYGRYPVAYVARSVRKAARNPILMRDRRCLRTGLVGFDYLRRCGHKPELHFAVDEVSLDADRLSAHCWVTIDGEPVINQRMDGQVTIYVHRSVV